MMQIAIIGIGAGAAAALLFASVTSGSWLSIPLFYLAPLPIMIAGLGWSHWAALTAALAGALGLGAVFGTVFLLAFPAGAGVPAWWLGYLAMLARPVRGQQRHWPAMPPLEWYPPGRLVVWAAVLAASGRDCRHSQFRHRRRKFSCRPAQLRSTPSCASDGTRRPMAHRVATGPTG